MQPVRVRVWLNIGLQARAGRPARSMSCQAALVLPAPFFFVSLRLTAVEFIEPEGSIRGTSYPEGIE